MPFKQLSHQFIIKIVKRPAILINSLPLDSGVYNDAMSAQKIVPGKLLHIPIIIKGA